MIERLPGWPLNRFSRVNRAWDGATVVCIGGGPSLTGAQCAAVAEARARAAPQVRVIAVNDAYRLAPWADVCYFADSQWWGWHKDKPEFIAFAGQKCSIQNTGMNIEDPSVHLLRNANYPTNGTGLSLDPESLVTGSNSGYQAINLAVLAGAKTVILLGYDGNPAPDGKTHFFGNHPRIEPLAVYQVIRQSFKKGAPAIKAAGVTVLNASPGSAIEVFEKMDIDKALDICDKMAHYAVVRGN